jgi:hypothetical protein
MNEQNSTCVCGKVRFAAQGRPIVCSICYCDDCQAGARQLKSLGANTAFQDAFGGAPYMTYRDDWVRCVHGDELLQGVKLSDDAPTTRFITTCCQSPMYLKYAPGWWTSMYRDRFGEDAAPIQFRSQTQHAQSALPQDVPTYRSFPRALFVRLLKARMGMFFKTRPH